jgi:hypothetical protein
MLRALASFDVGELHEIAFTAKPDLYRLAAAIVTWPYVPYTVLRKCRRLFRPVLPAYVESELCNSLLVDGCAIDGFCLEGYFRIALLTLLRSRCLGGFPDLQQELKLLRQFHSEQYGALSPLLAIEAEIAWDYVLVPPDVLSQSVDNRLRDVVFSAVREKRDGILVWIAAASYRLPPGCIEGEAAWLLSQFCRVQKLEMAPVAVPSRITSMGLIEVLSGELPKVVIGMERGRQYLKVGPPSPERSVGVVVVETDPMVLTVEDRSSTKRDPVVRTEFISRGEVRKIGVGPGGVVLGNLAGQTFTLAALSGNRSIEAMAADKVIQDAISARDRRTILPATVIRPVEAGYVVALETLGGTALMLSPYQELCEGDEIKVIVERVYPEKRWIAVEPVSFPDEWQMLDRSAIAKVPAALVPDGVEPGDVFPAVVAKLGKKHGNRRSVHAYVDPRCLLGGISHKWSGRCPGFFRFPGAARQIGDSKWSPKVGAKMSIVAAGKTGGRWQLRLRPPASGLDQDFQNPSLKGGDKLTGRVLSIHPKGADLEGPDGQMLWLPALHMALSSATAPIPIEAGEFVDVTVLGLAKGHSDRYLVTQRFQADPFLLRLEERRRRLPGHIHMRLANGQFGVQLDPIPGVSKRPFLAVTINCANRILPLGARVTVNVAFVNQDRWVLCVKNVQLAQS